MNNNNKPERKNFKQKNLGSGLTYFARGANKTVTGSMHCFQWKAGARTVRWAIDAGMIQEDESLNSQNPLPAGWKSLDFVVFSHGHTDHIGRYPILTKRNLISGSAFATKSTVAIMRINLPDGGHIQEEKAREKRAEIGDAKKAKLIRPDYTKQDAIRAAEKVKGVEFYKKFSPVEGVTVQLLPSSHLLGAAIVVMEVGTGNAKRRIVFSGDIGRLDMPCLKNAEPVKHADFLICESTYGAREHPTRNRIQALADSVNAAYKRAKQKHPIYGAGKIIIPVFANGRAQWILNDLRIAMHLKLIPNIPVFVDSPMAIKVTEIYRDFAHEYPERDRKLAKQIDLFRPPQYMECLTKHDSELLDKKANEPIIILSASGMASGGRILGHLKEGLQGVRNSVIFVGHQAEGTNGAILTSGEAKSIRIDETDVPIRAHIELLEDYSAHGDIHDLMRWLSHFEAAPKKVFLVHGDEEGSNGLKTQMEEKLGWKNVVIPEFGESFELA